MINHPTNIWNFWLIWFVYLEVPVSLVYPFRLASRKKKICFSSHAIRNLSFLDKLLQMDYLFTLDGQRVLSLGRACGGKPSTREEMNGWFSKILIEELILFEKVKNIKNNQTHTRQRICSWKTSTQYVKIKKSQVRDHKVIIHGIWRRGT